MDKDLIIIDIKFYCQVHFNSMDFWFRGYRFNIEIHKILVFKEYWLKLQNFFRYLYKLHNYKIFIFPSNTLTLGPQQHLTHPKNSPLQHAVTCVSLDMFSTAQYVFLLNEIELLQWLPPFSSKGFNIITWCSRSEQRLDQIRNNIAHQGQQRKMRVACTNDFSIIRLISTLK